MDLIMGVDPGETTGISIRDYPTGTFISAEMLRLVDLLPYLLEWGAPGTFTKVVIEDWRLYGHKAVAQTGNKMESSQAIGAVRLFALFQGASVVFQKPDILGIAELHSGQKKPTKHSESHWVDADNHLYYYLEKEGKLKPKGLS